jgi:hypothetical protein
VNTDLVQRVERACQDLLAAGQPITFTDVSTRVGTGRATLYRRPELRSLIEEHRQHDRDPRTLTGLTTQIKQLHATLEALAAKVRRHEEQLRQLNQRK